MQSRLRLFAVAAASVIALVACGKKEQPAPPAPVPAPAPAPAPAPPPAPVGVTVSNIALGKAVGADKKVTAPTDTFGKNDTIYVSVDTTGTGTAALNTRWTYSKDGKTVPVKEESATIAPTGPATSEFHISKADGWPTGTYQVEVLVDGKPAATKSFTVQ